MNKIHICFVPNGESSDNIEDVNSILNDQNTKRLINQFNFVWNSIHYGLLYFPYKNNVSKSNQQTWP